MTDVFESAATLASAIREGAVTAAGAMDHFLTRIRETQPAIHAMVQINEHAMAQAEAADSSLARGAPPGPLHGVPFSVKDWIETRDLVCSAGYTARQSFIPAQDATVVQRLRAAGGILLGKTKAGAVHDLYPLALNPHNPAHTAGASSSGEAALIAAGGSPMGVGSDSGGSLRWPAHCCGIATLKPTSGLVPLTGHFPTIIPLSDPRTVIGPMAKTVKDLSLVLPIIAGEDGLDASVIPFAPSSPLAVDLGQLRVAWFTDFGDVDCDDDTQRAIRRAAEILARAGIAVTEDRPELIEMSMVITRAYWARPESTAPDRWRPWGPSTLTADEVEESLFHWDRLRRAFTRFMNRYDVILCPVGPSAAPARLVVVASDYVFTVPFSLTGQPVVVIPAAQAGNGLPIGIQIVAKPFSDVVALAVARYLEGALTDGPA